MATIAQFSLKMLGSLLAMLLVGGCYTQLATVQSEDQEESSIPESVDSVAVEPEEDQYASSTQVYFHYYYPSGFVVAGGYCDPWFYGWPAYDPYYWAPYYPAPYVGVWVPMYPYSFYPYYYPPYPPYHNDPHYGGGGYAQGYGERRDFGNYRSGGSGTGRRGNPLVVRTGGEGEQPAGSVTPATLSRPVSTEDRTKPASVSRPTKMTQGKGARTSGNSRSGNTGRNVKEQSTQQRPTPAGQEKSAVGRGGSERSGPSPGVQSSPRPSSPPSHSGSSSGGGRGGSPRGGRR
jgi:hypothetical protein